MDPLRSSLYPLALPEYPLRQRWSRTVSHSRVWCWVFNSKSWRLQHTISRHLQDLKTQRLCLVFSFGVEGALEKPDLNTDEERPAWATVYCGLGLGVSETKAQGYLSFNATKLWSRLLSLTWVQSWVAEGIKLDLSYNSAFNCRIYH